MVDLELADELELKQFKKHLDNIENQYLNLIYNKLTNEVQERFEYEKSYSLIPWNCAICGCDIFIDRNRDDVENFVCNECVSIHNNNNEIVDMRIFRSRNKLYKFIENKFYDELEDSLKGGGV